MKPTAKSQAKARKFAKELDDVTPALIERAQGKCEVRIIMVCGSGMTVAHRHHKLQRNHPACTNDLSNLLYVCDACHTWIHAHPKESYALGLLLRGPQDMPGYLPVHTTKGTKTI